MVIRAQRTWIKLHTTRLYPREKGAVWAVWTKQILDIEQRERRILPLNKAMGTLW